MAQGLQKIWISMDFSSLIHILPHLGQNLLSEISSQYRNLIDSHRIPAFQGEEGAFAFRGGEVLLNNEGVGDLIAQNPRADLSFCIGLANSLEKYRRFYFQELRKRRKREDLSADERAELEDEASAFREVMGELLTRLGGKIRQRYTETTDGISAELDEEGNVWINGMSVSALLAFAKRYPTPKIFTFLRGLKNRLTLILARRHTSPHYENLRHTLVAVSEEIDSILGSSLSSPLALEAPLPSA